VKATNIARQRDRGLFILALRCCGSCYDAPAGPTTASEALVIVNIKKRNRKQIDVKRAGEPNTHSSWLVDASIGHEEVSIEQFADPKHNSAPVPASVHVAGCAARQ
jgi:hypothetical protein